MSTRSGVWGNAISRKSSGGWPIIFARDALEAVSREDLIVCMRDGLVTILDVNRLEQWGEYAPLQ